MQSEAKTPIAMAEHLHHAITATTRTKATATTTGSKSRKRQRRDGGWRPTNTRARRNLIPVAILSTIALTANLHLAQALAGSAVVPVGDAQSYGSGNITSTPRTRVGEPAATHRVPQVPFCRAGADVGTIWLPVWDPDSQQFETAKRVVVFGGMGLNYFEGGVSYLGDMWSLHITNTGFKWEQVVPQGRRQPSPRWQTGDTTAFGTSLVIYGGDDKNTSQVGALGDLWVYTPRPKDTSVKPAQGLADEWQNLVRGGVQPGPRREPSLTMLNGTLLLQGGKMVDGEMNEQCDSGLFLLNILDDQAEWRKGSPLPGACGVGQTMHRVSIPHAEGSKQRAVVFGGCQWSVEGTYVCSDDLHAYDIEEDSWETLTPKSDEDAYACASVQAEHQESASLRKRSGKKGGKASKSAAVCPGQTRPRPLGRHSHATAYVESIAESLHALFVFGGRETEDALIPLGDLWMFDFNSMRWSEITPDSRKRPNNRFGHSLSIWQGGAGDGVAGLVVFGGQTMGRTGQSIYMNDVWLYTPHTGKWREVSRSSCEEGASGIVRGGNWTALIALVSLLVLVVLVQCVLHNICPHYEPPRRWSRGRSRRARREGLGGTSIKERASTSALETGTGNAGANGLNGSRYKRPGLGSAPDLAGAEGQGRCLLGGSSQPSYAALE